MKQKRASYLKMPSAESQRREPIVSLEDVSLRLNGRLVFEHTCWNILDGQQWAVLGPNGSGKSLLMRALCGSLPLATGRITYHFPEELDCQSDPTYQRRSQEHIIHVAFDTQRTAVTQHGEFHQRRWNTAIGAEPVLVSHYLSARRVYRHNPYEVSSALPDPAVFSALRSRIIELLHIRNLLERSLAQLSNGEMRKVLIARALLREPHILILDNPFTGLDHQFRILLTDLIQTLIEGKTHVVIVTSRLDEIPAGITHILLVSDQQVIGQGLRKGVLGTQSARELGASIPSAPSPDRKLAKADTQFNRPAHSHSILVQMRNVTVGYGGVPVLSHFDWTVHMGDRWALLGPNGAGKTTLLSLILGDHPQAYANDITLFGRPRGTGESIWEIKQHIGWVSAELHLYYPRSSRAIDAVCSGFYDSVGLFQKCSAEQRETARAWMTRLGIERSAESPFASLSQGEQGLVLIARAMVKEPRLLILDEPCQGLDEHNRQRIMRTVDDLMTQPDSTLIYVTHEPDEFPSCITHVLTLP